MDLSQDFKPQTLFELLSRRCSFFPLPYRSDCGTSVKTFSKYERNTEKHPERVLHAIVMQHDLASRLFIAARDRTNTIRLSSSEPYYAHLLPYVAGLGPRKSQALVKKIASMVGK